MWNKSSFRSFQVERSYFSDLTLGDFDDLHFQSILASFLMVVVAFVILGKSVAVAVYETAFTFDTQQSDFLPTAEASLPVSLLFFGCLEGQFLHLLN